MSESDLKAVITTGESSCSECGENLGRRTWITLVEGKGALCLTSADLDHLLFFPAGDAALTRRSGKYSTLSAVVLRWSRARKRYERQGLLVEAEALERAEGECLADEEVRARRREREAARREEQDQQYVQEFANRVRELYPRCPCGREVAIAEHACLKYSGRVGRSAAVKSYDEQAIRLAADPNSIVRFFWAARPAPPPPALLNVRFCRKPDFDTAQGKPASEVAGAAGCDQTGWQPNVSGGPGFDTDRSCRGAVSAPRSPHLPYPLRRGRRRRA